MSNKSYQEKLLDRRWQIIKSRIMERDKFTCKNKSCTSDKTATLHVHHLYYLWHNPWEVTDDMLITLCSKCHEAEDNRSNLEKHLSNTLRTKGFLVSDLVSLSCKVETDLDFCKQLLHTLREFQNG